MKTFKTFFFLGAFLLSSLSFGSDPAPGARNKVHFRDTVGSLSLLATGDVEVLFELHAAVYKISKKNQGFRQMRETLELLRDRNAPCSVTVDADLLTIEVVQP